MIATPLFPISDWGKSMRASARSSHCFNGFTLGAHWSPLCDSVTTLSFSHSRERAI